MSANYAKNIPIDRAGNTLQQYPAAASALGTRAEDNASVSSVMNLTANTTTIEVAAINSTAFIKWTTQALTASVVSAEGSPNFDHVIPANTYRRFVVPRLTQSLPNYNNAGTPSIVGLNTAEGLFNAVAVKSAGIGSVLLTEF